MAAIRLRISLRSLVTRLARWEVRQICLAHLLRDAKYAIQEGDDGFAPSFRRRLLRALAIG